MPQAETHKVEIGANPSPDAMAMTENGGDGREWRWQGCIWRAERRESRERREKKSSKMKKKKKKTLNRVVRNIF